MNKSKFLKKSLAMLLAIMMVVAMIPLSAFATDADPAPADPAPVAAPKPVITVNNRNAEAPTEAGGAYTATVDDATTVSISWVPLTSEGWTAYLKTLRDVKVTLPFYSLDLTKEAEVIKDYDAATESITYQVEVILEKGTEGTDSFEQHTYYLDITAKTEAASDDVTLEYVKPNQSFQIGSTTWNFVGINGQINEDDETVIITLPLGYKPADAGFATAGPAFGNVIGVGGGTTPPAGSQIADQVYSNVFRPTADYSTVAYSFDANAQQGQVTVTARDGRSKNYTVFFTQETALDEVKVSLSLDATPSVWKAYSASQEYFDTNGVKTYVVEVPTDEVTLGKTIANEEEGEVWFTALNNVKRVEDPHDSTRKAYATSGWAAAYDTITAGESQDEPVVTGKNTFVFNNAAPFSASEASTYTTYLTVKTEANMAVNSANVDAADDGNKEQKFYANVKIVLVPKTEATDPTPSAAPQLIELQLNGYKAVWAEGKEIGTLNEDTGMRDVNITVDDAFWYSVGDGQHPARISMTLNNQAKVSIPAQLPNNEDADPYWAVPEITSTSNTAKWVVDGAINYLGASFTANRTNKPNNTANVVSTLNPEVDHAYIDNVKVEGGAFVLRVKDPTTNAYTDYNVKINRPAKKNGTDVKTVKLYMWNGTTKKFDVLNSTAKDTNNNFNFEVPASLYTTVAGSPDQLNATLSAAYLVIDADPGSVITPGGHLKNGTKTTVIGNSIWGADGYLGNYPVNDGTNYTELEEGYTTLGTWWNVGSYNVKNNNTTPVVTGGDVSHKDFMYFTVTNGRREQGVAQTVYSISFSLENPAAATPGPALSDVGTLTFGEASSYVDEDLIYGGNTVENAIIVNNSGVATAGASPAPVTPWAPKFGTGANAAFIEYADAEYVGAKTEKNTYKVLEPQPVSNDSRAKVIVVEVPENFLQTNANATKDLKKVVFDTITKDQANIAIYRGDEYAKMTAVATNGAVAMTSPYPDYRMPVSVSIDEQGKKTVTNFEFAPSELNAWNGNVFIPGNVSANNTLYTYSQKAQAAGVNSTSYTAKYYITVRRVKNSTVDQLKGVTATDKNNSVYTFLNESRKTITISVPYSYNWVGSRDGENADFTLDFAALNENATVIDAKRDAAFKYRDLAANPAWVVPANFNLTDLVKQQQDLFAMNGTQTYFVKNGELYTYNEKTGAETQITGVVNGKTDAFMNRQWGVIEAHEAEIRVYPQTRANVNTYKLDVVVRPIDTDAEITRVLVDETEATINGTDITVELPVGAIKTAVRVAVTVSPMAKIVSIDGKAYNPNDEQVYDLSKPIKIVIAAEDTNRQITYTLSADIPDLPTPTPTATPTPPPADKTPVDLNDAHSSLRPYIMTAIEEGLMQGNGNHFYPLNSMKRYEFALVVARASLRAEGETGTAAELDQKLIADYASCDFADVTAMNNAAVSAAVQYVFDKGYMKGISDTAFGPNGNITRQEAALTMARVAGLSLLNVDATDFADNAKIASWAIGGVNAVLEAGIMSGDSSNNTFKPLNNLSRAEGACILVRYFVEGKGQQPETPDEGDKPSTPDEGDEPSNPTEGDESSTPEEGEESSTPTEGDESSAPEEGEESSEPAE